MEKVREIVMGTKLEEARKGLEACGIDVEGTLKRMMGNEDLFLRMMRKFPEDHLYADLRKALEEERYDDAFNYAHTLNGVAGNLGLNPIMEADVVLVEKLRRMDTEGLLQDMEQLEAVYEPICEKLREL